MLSLPKSVMWYARHGWQIFPLRPRTKEPFRGIGVYNATTNLDKIAGWWKQHPQANIGMHCGGSNLLALDIDAYKDTYAGDSVLPRINEETVTNITGGGGAHLLYTLAEGVKYGNERGDLPPGLDIRGWGGYIVLPPSIHPNGERYTWEDGYGPHEIDPLPLPEELEKILQTRKLRTPGPPDGFAVAISRKMVLSVLERINIPTDESEYMNGGRKFILKPCPFQPENDPHVNDQGAYIVIMPDGHIAAGCHHERCREALKKNADSGWTQLVKESQNAYA